MRRMVKMSENEMCSILAWSVDYIITRLSVDGINLREMRRSMVKMSEGRVYSYGRSDVFS